jgi:PAS domain S-box-containing protein
MSRGNDTARRRDSHASYCTESAEARVHGADSKRIPDSPPGPGHAPSHTSVSPKMHWQRWEREHLRFSFRLRVLIARLGDILRLRGPLSGNLRARMLHALLLGILAWTFFHALFIQAFFIRRKPAILAMVAALALAAVASLYLLKRGSLRKAAIVYVISVWFLISFLVFLSGGIRSPALLFYAALGISAAWLFSYRSALLIMAGCIGSGVVLAILEMMGVGPYRYFPGTPIANLTILNLAVVIAGVPVAHSIKALQKALRECDADLRLAVAATGVGMFDLYPQTGKLVWSDTTRGHFGMPSEKEIDDGVALAALHPDDRERVRQTIVALMSPDAGGELATEFRSIGVDDGKQRWLAARGRMLFDHENRAVRMVGTILDISERKALEERLRQRAEEMEKLMRVAPTALLVSRDPECGEITGNRAGNEMFEAEEGANLSLTPKSGAHRDWRFFRDGVEILPKDLPLQVACATGVEVRDWEAEAVMPSGDRKYICGGASPLRDASGRIRGAVASYQDVTAIRQRTEATLRASDERFRSVTLFLANVNHELRTPLSAILGFASMLRSEEGLSDEQTRALDIIYRSGSHLLGLIDDVLDMAKIEMGHETLEITTVDVIELLRDVMDMMGAPAARKSIDLSLVWSGASIRLIRTDGPKLRRMLVNLLSNAVKYTDAGAVTLQVEMERPDEAGKLRLGIEVRDTGVGIALDEQARIFEPFVQLKRTNARKGSGLGLAICRELARIMGGTIAVKSSSGVGSIFRVELPVTAAKVSEPAGDVAQVESDVPEMESILVVPDGPHFRVLVIEEDEASCLLLTHLLERAGFQVRNAPDVANAMGVCSEWRPHFIWLDFRRQGLRGLDAITRLRALPGGRDVKISVFTAGFDEERDAVRAAGADDFVHKPWTPKTVFESMGRLLDLRYAHSGSMLKPVIVSAPSDLLDVERLPENLKSQLLDSVLLLDKARIIDVIGTISAIDPALGSRLKRHADALELTKIMRAVMPGVNKGDLVGQLR